MGQDTPMLRQYKQIKQEYADAILLFRLGDFYEMFLDDAEKAAEVLRLCSLPVRREGKRIPVQIPTTATGYIAPDRKKVQVAICEQVEDRKGEGFKTKWSG